MEAEVLIGVGGTLLGVVTGAALNFVFQRRARSEERTSDRAEYFRDRELRVAEAMDQELVSVQMALAGRLDLPEGFTREDLAIQIWEKAWVLYSARLPQQDLRDRYQSVGTILNFRIFDSDRFTGSAWFVQTAISNARVGLAWHLRGENPPGSGFPEPKTLLKLFGQAETDGDLRALRQWCEERPLPSFHPGVSEASDSA